MSVLIAIMFFFNVATFVLSVATWLCVRDLLRGANGEQT